jgi:hypothetical protein
VSLTVIENNPAAIPIAEMNPLAKIAVPIGRKEIRRDLRVRPALSGQTARLLAIECKLMQKQKARREVVA